MSHGILIVLPRGLEKKKKKKKPGRFLSFLGPVLQRELSVSQFITTVTPPVLVRDELMPVSCA